MAELQRIEREIRPSDALFFFDIRAGDNPTKNDAKMNRLIESIFSKHKPDGRIPACATGSPS
jgi:hypothetical protein